MHLSRRALIASLAAIMGAFPALAAQKRRKPSDSRAARDKHLPSTQVAKLTGNPVPIPPLLEVAAGETLELKAVPIAHAFWPDKPVDVIGYNGAYSGPTIRLTRGTAIKANLVNGLSRPTNLHWHGLVVDPDADAALISIPPGDTWETTLNIDQPPATLWYHEHMAGGMRPHGVLIVSEPTDAALQLPASYGIDDFPLILDDATFGADGKPIEPTPDLMLLGPRGSTVLVNGVAEGLLKVPQRLVRLRVVNAARARVFRLFMDDERSFQLIACDGGYLDAPVEIDTLILSPGERAEIIVDFADGSTALLSTPDDVDVHARPSDDTVAHHADPFDKPFRVLAFEAVKDAVVQRPLPVQLPMPPAKPVPDDVRHRRFDFAVATGSADLAGTTATINGNTFNPKRADVAEMLGKTEIWQLVARHMPTPVHVSGAQFRVLSEDGDSPRAWNRGLKDTVFVETTVEVAVTFTLPATLPTPCFIETANPEQSAAGALATVVVG